MKPIFIITILMCFLPLDARSQTGLEINRLFGGKYVNDPAVTETVISGNQKYLRSNGLTALATFKADADRFSDIVEPLVLADGTSAMGRDVRYSRGHLAYAYFMLKPKKVNGKNINRYIYYLTTSDKCSPQLILLYIEGTVPPSKASSLIRKLAKSGK